MIYHFNISKIRIRLISSLILILFLSKAKAQENNVWVIDGENIRFSMDFNYEPPKMSKLKSADSVGYRYRDPTYDNISICDESGQLLFYTIMNSKHYLQVFDNSYKLAFIHTHKNAGLPYFHFIDIQGDSIIIIDYVDDYNFIESGPIMPDTVKLYKTIYNKQTYEKIDEVFLKQYVRNSLETSRFKPLILKKESEI